MTGLATNFVEYFKGKREAALETLVRITFGTFMGGLVLLLTLATKRGGSQPISPSCRSYLNCSRGECS